MWRLPLSGSHPNAGATRCWKFNERTGFLQIQKQVGPFGAQPEAHSLRTLERSAESGISERSGGRTQPQLGRRAEGYADRSATDPRVVRIVGLFTATNDGFPVRQMERADFQVRA